MKSDVKAQRPKSTKSGEEKQGAKTKGSKKRKADAVEGGDDEEEAATVAVSKKANQTKAKAPSKAPSKGARTKEVEEEAAGGGKDKAKKKTTKSKNGQKKDESEPIAKDDAVAEQPEGGMGVGGGPDAGKIRKILQESREEHTELIDECEYDLKQALKESVRAGGLDEADQTKIIKIFTNFKEKDKDGWAKRRIDLRKAGVHF